MQSVSGLTWTYLMMRLFTGTQSLLPPISSTFIVDTSTRDGLAFSRNATHFALSSQRLGTLYSSVLLVLRQLSHRSCASGAVVGYGASSKQSWTERTHRDTQERNVPAQDFSRLLKFICKHYEAKWSQLDLSHTSSIHHVSIRSIGAMRGHNHQKPIKVVSQHLMSFYDIIKFTYKYYAFL